MVLWEHNVLRKKSLNTSLQIRREGRNAYYRLADDRVTNVMRCMMKAGG